MAVSDIRVHNNHRWPSFPLRHFAFGKVMLCVWAGGNTTDKSPCEQRKNIERFRTNKMFGQIFQPVENSSSTVDKHYQSLRN